MAFPVTRNSQSGASRIPLTALWGLTPNSFRSAQEHASMRFHTRLLQSGKSATGLQVPPEVVEQLGAGKRPAVSVTLRGHTYRSTIAPMGGVYMLPVSAEIRGITGLAGGDAVDVEVELDTAPRVVTIPPDFVAALDAETEAKSFFETLSYSTK